MFDTPSTHRPPLPAPSHGGSRALRGLPEADLLLSPPPLPAEYILQRQGFCFCFFFFAGVGGRYWVQAALGD